MAQPRRFGRIPRFPDIGNPALARWGEVVRNFLEEVAGAVYSGTGGLVEHTHLDTTQGGTVDHGALTGRGDDDHTQYILVAGTRAFTGDQSMGGNQLTSVGTPSAGTDAATKDYVDSSAAGSAAQYVTLATDAGLTNERVLTGTANQVTVTDGGAGAAVTLSTPQDLATSSAVVFGSLKAPFIYGGVASGGALQLIATSHATQGMIYFGPNGEATFDSTNGWFAVGTLTPAAELHVKKNGGPTVYVEGFSDDAGARPGIACARAGGTIASPTGSLSGQFLGEMTFRGHNGTSMVATAQAGLRCRAAADWSGTSYSTEFDLITTPVGSTSAAVAVQVTSAQGIIVTGEVEIDGALNHDGSTVGFFGTAPATQQTALTTQSTTITHTAPGTPDYALQDLVDSAAGSAFGFATKDEGNTLLQVVANLQARVQELEDKLQAYGLLA